MKRRLFFMLPSVASARSMLDELLLARVEERNMHFYAKEGTLPCDMPEANLVQKSDLINGVETGMMIGACSGLIAGSLFMMFPPDSFFLIAMLYLSSISIGAVLGSWISAVSSANIPNSKLIRFKDGISKGQVLLMIDVPLSRVREIQKIISNKNPKASFDGMEIHLPVVS